MTNASPFERIGTRERQRQETRARLLQAAISEFSARGFDRTSVADIARAANVSRPAFYAHFPTKEHVLFELQWKLELELCDRISGAPTLRSALDELATFMVDLLESEEYAGVAPDMFRLNTRPGNDALIQAQPFPLIEELGRLFAKGAERGELRAGLSPERAPLLCMTGIFGYIAAGNPDWDRRAEIQTMAHLYLADDA